MVGNAGHASLRGTAGHQIRGPYRLPRGIPPIRSPHRDRWESRSRETRSTAECAVPATAWTSQAAGAPHGNAGHAKGAAPIGIPPAEMHPREWRSREPRAAGSRGMRGRTDLGRRPHGKRGHATARDAAE